VGGVFHVGDPLVLTTASGSTPPRLLNTQEELDAFATNGILRWSAVAGATQYEAWVFTNPTASAIKESSGPLSVRSYQTRTLSPGNTYYVQVFALVDGKWQVGAPVRVVVAEQVTKARLTNAQEEIEAFATNGTLRWTEVPGASAYEIWIYANAGMGRVAENSGTNTARAYQITRLCQDGTYYVLVYANVNGIWTAGGSTPLHVSQGGSPAGCVPPVPTVKLAANPLDIAPGGSTTLSWTSQFATSCTASGGWSSAKAISGQEVVGPLSTNQLYVLSCTGASGTSQGEVYVTAAGTRLSVADAQQVEGDAGRIMLNFPVLLERPADRVITVDFETVPGTASIGVDYESVTGSVTLAAGATSGIVSVPVYGDTAVEPSESLELRLASAAQDVTLVDGIGVGTIVNDDPNVVVITVGDASRIEGAIGVSYLAFPVTSSRTPSSTVSFSFETVPGTATSGVDYAPQAGVFSLDPASLRSGWITVPINGDTAAESNETFELKLSAPSSAVALLEGRATGTIVDDDAVPGIAGISITDVARAELNSGTAAIPVQVILDRVAVTPVSVDYVTVPITAVGGEDYTATGGRLTVPAGATGALVNVPIVGDTTQEPTETLELRLSNASANAAILDDAAVVTILNDDSARSYAAVSVTDATVSEGNSGSTNAVFTISLDRAVDASVTVEFQTVPVTATPGTDFTMTSGTVQFAVGDISRTISVPVTGDASVESNETFELRVQARTVNAYVADGVGIGMIIDDDGTPAVLTTPGIWYGEIRDNESGLLLPTKAIVSESGQARFLVQYRDGPAYSAGQFFGAVPTTVTQLSPVLTGVLYPDRYFANGDRVAPVTLAGTVTPLGSWSGTFVGGGDSGTFALNYQRGNYERWSSLDLIAGTYSGVQIHDDSVDPFGYGVKLTISGSGTLTGSDTRGCAYSGQVSIVNADRNYYALRADARNCTAQRGEYTGLVFFDLVGDGLTRLIYLANNGNSIWTGAVSRQDADLIGITIGDKSLAEGNDGTTAMTFRLSLERAAASDVTVNYTTVPGTATPGVDYSGVSGALTIPAGSTSATVTVSVIGDTVPETNEWFGVRLSTPSSNAFLFVDGAQGTIVDDDTVRTTPGLWNGDLIDGASGIHLPTRALVTESGEIRFLLMPPGETDPRYIYGQVFGTVPVSSTAFAASLTGVVYYDNYWSNNELVTVVRLDSDVSPKVSWSGEFTETPGFGTFEWTYQKDNFERPSSLGLVAGSYAGTQTHDTGYEYSVAYTISSGGVLTGTDSRGCRYSGSVLAVNPDRNYYRLHDVRISSCPEMSLQVNGTYSGLAFFDSTGGGLSRLIYMTNINGGREIWTGSVSRQ
jgi:hypothetical protein